MIYCSHLFMKRFSPFISILLVITTLAMSGAPLFTKEAKAVGTFNNIIPSSTSVALLQCANKDGVITDALGSVFDGLTNNLFNRETSAGSSNQTTYSHATGSGGVGDSLASLDSLGIKLAGFGATLNNDELSTGSAGADAVGSQRVEPGLEFGRKLDNIEKATQRNTESASNSECMKSLGTAALHDLLAASTQSIVNWINTGFDGDPLFIQNPHLFFKGVADQQVYSFVAELNNPEKYPFGPEIGASIAAMYNCDTYTDSDNNCFNNTAIFTLGAEIGADWQDFYSDFNVGGWGGWLAATQNPANNPFDFQFMASKEIQARIDMQQQTIKEEIQQNGGFLSLRKCVLYNDDTHAEDQQGGTYVDTGTTAGGTYDASSFNYEYSYFGQIDNCKQYAVTTPGSLVADQLNIHLGASANAVAMGDEVNTSIAAIFDALTNQLIDQGLASLDNQTVITQQTGGYGTNYFGTNSIGSSWYTDPYAPANLHTLLKCVTPDTGTAIENCKTQIELTEEYLGVLYEARDYLNGQLIPALYKLDMHMPEPDIGWQSRMQQELIAKTTEINNKTKAVDVIALIGPVVGAIATVVIAIPVVGPIADTVILAGAALVGVVLDLFVNSDEKIATMKQQAVGALNARYQVELKRIQWDIDNNNLPSAFDARLQRDKIPGYEKTRDAYVSTITQQVQVLQLLKQIASGLGATEATTDGTSGTRDLEALRSSYAGISGKIVSQGTIDNINDNQPLLETDLLTTQEADTQILTELELQPFGGLDYTIPENLYHFWTEASLIADISYALGDCTLESNKQQGHCPISVSGYNPQDDNYHLLDVEAWAFGHADGVSQMAPDGTPYTETEKMEHAHTTADFLRLYPQGFTISSLRQNPYSVFYPYPVPPLKNGNPWRYEKLLQHNSGETCLALKPIDLPYSTCATPDPLLIYTRLNPTAFNTFDHLETSDEKSLDKEIYLNYFIDSYRNPNYSYPK